ncbi:MAG: Spo0E family sporulation regulatory protein-aspartic acid phosphatase [Lutisporaceae bacterium]
MTERNNLLKKIEELKLCLDKLISEKNNLQDEEIIKLSKTLDLVLNEYNHIVKNEKK